MANDKRKYIIQQKLSLNDILTLWPETVGSQIIQETEYRLIGKNTILLGGTYSGPDTNPATLTTGAGNYSTTINASGSLVSNITLTLPGKTGTIALTSDIPNLSFSDGLLDGSFNTETGVISLNPYSVAADGKLSWTSSTVAGTTALSYSGSLYVNNFDVSTNAVIDGTLTVGELSNLNGGIAVDTNKFTVADGTGNVYTAGTLDVTGATTLSGLLNANAGIAVDTNKFTVQDGTGNTYIAGTLEVDGTTQLDGILDVNNSVDIDAAAGTLTADVQSISLDSTATSNFTVTGANATASNLVLAAANSSTGTAQVQITAKSEIDLTAPAIDINGAVDISSTLAVGGNTTLTGDLSVNGGDLTTTAGTFNLLNKNLTNGQSYTINIGQGTDTGTTTRLINIGNAAGTVVIPGNLTVQGDNFIANTTTVTTDDDIIQLRSSAVTAMTNFAGLVATKYDGTHDGALVFDNSGTAWVGDVTIQPNGSIVDVSMQAIATRETTPTTSGVPFWDATTNKFATNTEFTFTNTGTILDIDNLRLDGNSILSTNTNGSIILDPNGTGTIGLQAITNVTGLLNANGGIAVDTDKFTVQDGTGNTNIAGTLGVTGTTTLSSLLNANGGIAVDTNKFTVADATGNTYIAGTLEVDSTTQLDGTVDINNSTTIDGAVISLDATTSANFNIAGNSSSATDLVLGAMNSGAGTASILATAKTEIDLTAPTIDINGTTTIDGANISLDATTSSNFTVTGASATASDLVLSAANSSTGTAQVQISAKTEIDLTAPNIDINGAADVSGSLTAGSFITTGTFNKVIITQPATSATLTIANGKTLTSNVNFTVGAASTYTGDITIRSSNETAKTLTLGDNSTINSLTSGHVLYASADDTISSEAQLAVSRGGTGIGSYTLGDMIYASNTTTLTKLAGSITSTKKFLTQTGNGSASAAPAWGDITNADLPDSTSVKADIDAYNTSNDPDVTEMTYTAVSVNRKGIVTAGAYVLEVGAPGQTAPSPELIYGGLFFKDVSPV